MTGEKIRVLVFPAGEMNSAEICEALSRQVNIEVYGASSVDRLGRHLFRRYRGDLPNISAPDFLDAFAGMLAEWSIDLVIPTHDSVVEFFAEERDRIPCPALVPDVETARACRDKRLSYDLFRGAPFVPRVYRRLDAVEADEVFVKPARGQGSVGARRVKTVDGHVPLVDWESEIVCEYLDGEEATVDCFTDRHGLLLGVFPRSRDRTLGGISVSGRALRADRQIREIAAAINERLRFLGMWYFQTKRASSGDWKLLEISARGAGTQCLTRARGINLPLLSVYAATGRDVVLLENPYTIRMDQMLVSLYEHDYVFNVVYIDFDDTIVHGSGVDPEMMALLYQFRRDGKRIILVTRHAHDLAATCRQHRIDIGLFDEIRQIGADQPKAEVISPKGAIFIDNAFAERMAVRQIHGIPVFDVEGCQVLKSWGHP